MSAAEEAARLLLAARERRTPLAAFPEACRPRSLAAGYEVQEALERLDGRPLAGWKIGGTSARIQQALGLDRPFPGRVFAPTLYQSPARVARHEFIALALEPEFAFRMGRDLPPRAAPYARAEVAAAVASLHPACELVDTRLPEGFKSPAPCLVADNGCHAALVEAAAVADWRRLDLARQKVTFSLNGKELAAGMGADVLGHPLEALTWLANDLSRRGFGLKAGQIVTTGTCCGFHPLKAGDEAVADYGALGRVAVTVVE
ncbi:MAG TPA: fumarylacetoacetate hydrolase family protein [Alphaproteobacteria bacterium]|nr:fumarylacetoacetate hydrolase family protein [Alphaproteobacteria bacterium]